MSLDGVLLSAFTTPSRSSPWASCSRLLKISWMFFQWETKHPCEKCLLETQQYKGKWRWLFYSAPKLQAAFSSLRSVRFQVLQWHCFCHSLMKNTSLLQVYSKCTFSTTVQSWLIVQQWLKRVDEWYKCFTVQTREHKWNPSFLIPCLLSTLSEHRGKPVLSHMPVCLQKLFQCCPFSSPFLLQEIYNTHIPFKCNSMLI